MRQMRNMLGASRQKRINEVNISVHLSLLFPTYLHTPVML